MATLLAKDDKAIAEHRREGHKTLTQTHLEELLEKRLEADKAMEEAGVVPVKLVPGEPPPAMQMIQNQAIHIELARARNVRGPKPAEPDKTYTVVHNGQEFKNVKAQNSLEAWAKVCDGAKNWPSPKTALVTEVVEKKAGEPADEKELTPGVSPVADDNQTDAKDRISRMTSREKLQAIIDNDHRINVQVAARDRLAAL